MRVSSGVLFLDRLKELYLFLNVGGFLLSAVSPFGSLKNGGTVVSNELISSVDHSRHPCLVLSSFDY